MILDKNSITARLYRWFYATNEMPKSLCPYAWRLLFMWIAIIPFYLVTLPSRIFDDSKDTSPVKRVMVSVLIFTILYVVFSMLFFLIMAIFFNNTSISEFMFVTSSIGFFGWFTLVVIGLVKLVDYISDKISDINYNIKHKKTRTKSKTPSVTVEFIKAIYNKYCPKIDWE